VLARIRVGPARSPWVAAGALSAGDERFWLVTIFLASAALRGWLSIINQEANDDHLEVANLIRQGGWLPPASWPAPASTG
jgi:hypothetical protein